MRPSTQFLFVSGAWLWLPALILMTGCEVDTPDRATAAPSGLLTQISSTDGRSVSIGESPGSVTVGANAVAQDPAQCTPDGKYVTGNTIVLDFAEQTVKQEIEQTKRTLDDVTSRIEQCRGKSKGLPDYDAQFGCDRARFRELQARMLQLRAIDPTSYAHQQRWFAKEMEAVRAAEKRALWAEHARLTTERTVKGRETEMEKAARRYLVATEWQQASDALKAARAALDRVVQAAVQANEAEKRSTQAEIDQLGAICARAETAYEQNPCNSAQLASDAFARNRAQQRLAALEARRGLIEDCRKDRERQARGAPGMSSPTAEQLLLQTLPGIMGGFGPQRRPVHPPPKHDKSRDPHWDGHKN